MKRDGFCTSLWQDTTDPYIVQPKTGKDKLYDVLIVGGGITGITSGLILQKAGKKCMIAEAHSICFGTTGGTTAHFNNFFDTTYEQIKKNFGEDGAQLASRAASKANDLFRNNIREYEIQCDQSDRDGFLFSQDEKQTGELDAILSSSKALGISVEYADSIPVPIPFKKSIVFHRQGQFHPARYVTGLAKAFEESGGVIVENCRVLNVEENSILKIETSAGEYKALQLIYATHIPPGVNLLHFRCAPYRSYAMAAVLKNDDYPKALAYDLYDPYHYYRTQEVDGKKFLIAGGEDHKTAHVENTEVCFKKLESYIRQYFEIDKVVYKWSSQYFEPADGIAYIGRLPGHRDNVYVATGFGGNGMTYSHIAALIFGDLLVKGESEFAELYDPNRIKIVAGFSNFVKENADVASSFISGRFSAEKLEIVSDLSRGEAKIIKYEGERLGCYKDENGNLHSINPVCTHIKCIVCWNSAEKSWDCPCHGARYSPDGEVLTGPASKELQPIKVEEIT